MTGGPARAARLSVLARLQMGLEALYRVETRLAIDAFVVGAAVRDQMATARAPREQLLLRQEAGELEMALFVDAAAVANLEQNDPAARLDERNFADFCLAVEGVSHFIYVALRAADDLDDEERARYRAANAHASRYAGALERRFVRPERTEALLSELRQFYRMDLPDKLGHIARLA